MNTKSLALAAFLMLPVSTWAGDEPAALDRPSLSTTQTVKLTAVVEAIDHETRQVTLRGPEGNTHTFTASDEAHNLDQVNPGDTVNAEYVQNITIEVFANDGSEPGAGSMSAIQRAAKGETPGMAAMDTSILTATIEAIDIEANTFKLKWPEGEVEEYTARVPENLKKVVVGDMVVITYTEALAVVVEETAAE
jgi:Cu/Ag efflux protein CusF